MQKERNNLFREQETVRNKQNSKRPKNTTTNNSVMAFDSSSILVYEAPATTTPVGSGIGSCPTGALETENTPQTCPGFSATTIRLTYTIPPGTQHPYHHRPGRPYHGTTRVAYLPNNPEGRKLLVRFQYAWMRGLTFGIGTSATTGKTDAVVWNSSFHHKTSLRGGPFGFPDPRYLSENHENMDKLGIPDADSCRAQLPALLINNQNNNNYNNNHARNTTTATTITNTSLAVAAPAAASAAFIHNNNNNINSSGVGANTNNSIAIHDFDSPHIPSKEKLSYVAPRTLESSAILDTHLESIVGNGANNGDCPICFDALSAQPSVRIKRCSHSFHRACIEQCFARGETKCPICRKPVGKKLRGKCPSGTMTIRRCDLPCPGFATVDCHGSIQISYDIPNGTQGPCHEHPGRSYTGTTRTAYLPNNGDGRRLLARLKHAWMHGLVFSIGTSLTTNRSNVVVWTSIHHKTSLSGGPHGFPDPNYVFNCNSELDALGVPTDPHQCLAELSSLL